MNVWKRLKQALSLSLVLAMLSQLPLVANAMPPNQDDIVVTDPVMEEQATEEPVIISEFPDERDEYTKYFLLDNGSQMAVQYAVPVHFAAADGGWQQYDNSMEETTDILDTEAQSEEIQTYAQGSESESAVATEYKVKQSDQDIRLAQKAGSKKIVTVEKDGNKISWGFTGAAKVPVEFAQQETAGEGNDAFLNLTSVMQEAWYHDVFPNVDLQYLITPTGVKENIVLKSADAQTDFTMEYKFHQLTAVQVDDKTIELQDKSGKTVYTITAPMMQDAKGEWSNSLSISILEAKNNKLKIKLSADAEWLHSADRAFPVTVDPSFATSKAWGTVDSTTLESGHPNATHGQGTSGYIGTLYVGYEPNSSFGKTRALVKLNTLPQLSPGDMIINAKLYLLQKAAYPSIQVNAQKVTSNWSMKTATWNNMSNGCSSDIIVDYDITDSGDNINKYNVWDITSMTREWYSGKSPNYGVMLTSPSETASSMARVMYYASTFPNISDVRPVFQITYRNNRGLENYWTYHTQALANGSVGSINDYSGNLVYQVPVMSESGCRLPISVNLSYNGYTSHQQFLNGASGLVTGKGWQANTSQRCWCVEQLTELGSDVIAALQAAGYKRIYIDEDGTVHYFKTTTNDFTLEDEDGLGMTMKINAETDAPYLIECKDGSKIRFTAYGYLYQLVDADGNTATVDYSGNYMTKITDGAGRVTTFAYSAYGSAQRLTKVTDPAGRSTVLTYSGDNLQKVTYPDGTSVQFAYSSITVNGGVYNRISRVTDKDGTYVQYGYPANPSATEAAKVDTVQEFAADGTAGNSMTVRYNLDNTTKFTYVRSGVTTSETYSFDNLGRTVCIINADGSASTYEYSSGAGKTSNRVSKAAQGEKYVNNLLRDPSGEDGTGAWTGAGGGAPYASYTIDTSQYYLGSKSLKISQSAQNDSNYGFYQNVSMTAGKTYTLSAYVKTENVVSRGIAGAALFVGFFGANGNIAWDNMVGVSGTNDWQRIHFTFTAPEGTLSAQIFCSIRLTTGTVWYDCIQLEAGDTANDYNMLQESDFSSNSYWKGDCLQSGDGVDLNLRKGVLIGYANTAKNIYQTVKINKKNIGFKVSAKAQANSVPTGYDSRLFAIDLRVDYSDGTKDYRVYSFNDASSGEQYLTAAYMIPQNKKELTVTSVLVILLYYKNCNTAYFDDVMLTFDETGTAYTYDSKGNVVSAKDNANRNNTCTYSGADELTQYTDEKNESYSYTYAAANGHRLVAARSNQLGNGFTYDYDAYGNVTGSKMGTVSTTGTLSTASPYLQSGTTYNSTGNYVTAVSDQRGNTTSYNLNNTTGLINSVTDAKGNTTNYTYESGSLLLLTVSGGGVTNRYTYDSYKRLSTILHNGTTYRMNYDKFGNTSSVQVGTQTLVTNNYAANNGNLTSAVYGNRTTYGYSYDTYDRVTSMSINGTQKYTTVYNNKGQVAQTNDLVINRKTEYTYDISGRLLRTFQPNFSDISTSYDIMNRVTGINYSFAGQTKTAGYSYGKDGLKANSTLISGAQRSTVYDSLNRETSMSIGSLNRSVSYLNVSGNRTTTLPASLSYTQGGTTLLGTSYTYDALGNITSMTVDGVTYTYTYDALNQLKTVSTSDNSYTASYNYDNGGNITSKTVNGTTISYGYGDTNWTDKLTSYNGQSITYDAIGNPLSYRGMTMNWTGRRLNSVINNGTTSSYLYDADGIRTRKTVGSTMTECFTSGSTILAEKTGSDVIWYIYDSDGEVLGFTYNGTPYYYLKNAQGDVVSIVDAGMNVVGSYTYDAWGKVTSASGSMANVNPIRYRSYYYDTETNLYYLQSRYYDPETGRFVSADSPAFLGVNGAQQGYNLFAYCNNNPVNQSDPTGQFVLTTTAIILITGAAVTLVSGLDMGISASMSGQDFWAGFGAGCLGGAAGFIFSALTSTIPTLSLLGGRALSTAITGVCNESFQKGNLDSMNWGGYAVDIVMDTTFSMVYTGTTSNIINENVGNIITAVADGAVDIFQTNMYYSPKAQAQIKALNNTESSTVTYRGGGAGGKWLACNY